MKRLQRLLLAATIIGAGCATTDLPTSGLLGSYSDFESRGPDLMVQQIASEGELASYRRVRVDRVHLYLEAGTPARDLPRGIQRSLAASLQNALKSELSAHYELVQDLGLVGEDVLNIRLTLTDLQLADQETGEVASATVEVEIVDAVTGERLAAAVSRKPAKELTTSVEEGLEAAEEVFAEWALNLRLWLDDATGA